jgi:hypothetical protein
VERAGAGVGAVVEILKDAFSTGDKSSDTKTSAHEIPKNKE